MGRKRKFKKLDVFFNGQLVGKLSKASSGLNTFQYAPLWIEKGIAISNSLPLQENEYKGEIVTRYFDNLLPDNDEIKKKVAIKFGAESIRSFDLLSVIGKDCVGGLMFQPEGEKPQDITELRYRKVTNKEIAETLRNLGGSQPLGMDNDKDFRLSIAGAQEKTAYLKINNQWHEAIGATPTTHIFKSPIGAMGSDLFFEDSIDNEWICLKVLKKFGLDACEASIGSFDDQRALVVTRFDRRWEMLNGKKFLYRVPQEDMCQAMGISPYQKYQNEGGVGAVDICKHLRTSIDERDLENFFKALILFDLLYAPDGHAKNFSVFLKREGIKLTPLYDVMSIYFLIANGTLPEKKAKLAMKIGKSGHYSFKRIQLRHYRESAKLCGIHEEVFDKIYEDIRSSYERLNLSATELPKEINQITLDYILQGIKNRAKVLF